VIVVGSARQYLPIRSDDSEHSRYVVTIGRAGRDRMSQNLFWCVSEGRHVAQCLAASVTGGDLINYPRVTPRNRIANPALDLHKHSSPRSIRHRMASTFRRDVHPHGATIPTLRNPRRHTPADIAELRKRARWVAEHDPGMRTPLIGRLSGKSDAGVTPARR
jgi:hypothetical protein